MKNKKFAFALASAWVMNFTVHAADINPARCGTWGDSLNQPEAEGRRAWTARCFPMFRGQVNMNHFWSDGKDQRLAYPTFGKVGDDGSVIADGPKPNTPAWYAPTDPQSKCEMPEGYTLLMFCAAGCYAPEQRLLFNEGAVPVQSAHAKDLKDIMTVSRGSSIDHIELQEAQVQSYTTDLVEGVQDIVEIQTVFGGKIRVTPDHPLVDGMGRMRAARTLRVGEALMTVAGDREPIESVRTTQFYGKVYNLEVNAQDPADRIVVAEGFLSGTVYFQNEGVKDLNRVIFRNHLIPESIL